MKLIANDPYTPHSDENPKDIIRFALEDALRFRFYFDLAEVTKKDGGEEIPAIYDGTPLGTMIEKLKHSSCKFKASDRDAVLNELQNLNNFSKVAAHSPSHTAHISAGTDTTKIKSYAKSALELIDEGL